VAEAVPASTHPSAIEDWLRALYSPGAVTADHDAPVRYRWHVKVGAGTARLELNAEALRSHRIEEIQRQLLRRGGTGFLHDANGAPWHIKVTKGPAVERMPAEPHGEPG
jgi:hypothetical protein